MAMVVGPTLGSATPDAVQNGRLIWASSLCFRTERSPSERRSVPVASTPGFWVDNTPGDTFTIRATPADMVKGSSEARVTRECRFIRPGGGYH
jgi:hypothetical protein